MIFFTKHALEKMDGLAIEKDEVVSTIAKGMKWKEEKRDAWHAQMSGIEAVFMKEEDNIIVITVYLARRSK